MPDGTALPPDPVSTAAGDDGAACARTLAARQVEALGELVGIGLKIARGIERRVDALGEETQPQGDGLAMAELNAAAIAFSRVSRALRQTIMLQARLLEARDAATARAGDLRVRLGGIVRCAIEEDFGEGAQGDAERVERLVAEAAERLEQECYGDVLVRPVREIVAGICKDLGLEPDWRGLEDDLAAAEAFARGGAEAAEAVEGSGPFDVFWLGADGRPTPAPAADYPPKTGWPRPYDPSRDPALRTDSS